MQTGFNRAIISVKKIISHRYFPVLVILAINLCIGIFVVDRYGESWDEANNKLYGEQSLEAYSWWVNKDIELSDYLGPTNQRYRGAAFPMLANLFVSGIKSINTDWFSSDLWHFASFLCYQLGVFFFYMICLRYLNTWAAFGSTLLLVTQPLLWGHAFINSKDIPLMVFFLGSVALGLKMVDSFLPSQTQNLAVGKERIVGKENLRRLLMQDWGSAKSRSRKALVFFTGLQIAILLTSRFIQGLIVISITNAYYAGPSSFLGSVFYRLASNKDSVPLEAYINKGMFLHGRIAAVVIIILFILILILCYRIFRNSLVEIGQIILSGYLAYFSKWYCLLAAAVMLGLSVSTRVGGVLAGALIAVYFLVKVKKKSIIALIAYASISIFVTYITWPFLWQNPIGNFIESLIVSSDFGWTGNVLFQGVQYKSYDLPASYLPVLLILQLTEPVIFLFWIGVILAIVKMLNRKRNWEEIFIILAWFFIPFLLVIIFKPLMYDNFRHWLFIVPPIFILAGFALDELSKCIKPRFVNLAILIVLISPGLYWGVKLHPYQYIYYNNFVGGVGGANRRYELDFWVTSYREATMYLNDEAPLNSQVLVIGPRRIFRSYAREDLDREWFRAEQIEESTYPVYVIISTRRNDDLIQFPDSEVVYRVTRDGADLAVVKQIK